MSEEFDELGRWLENEWMVGFALRAYEEMAETLRDLSKERNPRRVQDLIARAEQEPSLKSSLATVGGEAMVLTCQMQALVESALMAVAIYLAKHQDDASRPSEG